MESRIALLEKQIALLLAATQPIGTLKRSGSSEEGGEIEKADIENESSILPTTTAPATPPTAPAIVPTYIRTELPVPSPESPSSPSIPKKPANIKVIELSSEEASSNEDGTKKEN